MVDLRERLTEVKEKSNKKKIRKAKWENWKKTQAMFYCKTSTNYNKWDMFESDESSNEDEEPIVPSHDPQFQAMEQEFKDRHKRRRMQKGEVITLKTKGNEAMKRGLYKSAYKHYSDCFEHRKDILEIYTNRALAGLKLEKTQSVIDDCTRVLDYCEVFDECYTKQPHLCYKAFMRRG